MAFPYDTDDQTAIDNLASVYNGSDYDAGTNPGGFGQGGHRTNFIPALQDVATVAEAVADAADAAETSATNAASSATDAEAAADSLAGTSTTSVAIGTGSKSFTTQSGKAFTEGRWLNIRSDANPTDNYMIGQVTAYSGTSLTVDVTAIGGSGTLSDWTIDVSAAPGQTGAIGATGSAGATTGLEFAYSNGTTDSDPGNGTFKLSSTTFASISTIYIDNVDRFGNTVSTILDLWDDTGKSTDRGRLTIVQISAPSKRMTFTVTGSVVDGTGYRKVSVTPVGTGTVPSNGENCTIGFTPTGLPGADGVGAGDVIGDDTSPAAGEVALYSDTTGKHIEGAGGGIGTSGHNLGWLDGNNTYSGTSAYSQTVTVTYSDAKALAVGRQGATDPALQVDSSTASSTTGVKVTAAAAGNGVSLAAISSGTNETLKIDAKGSGTIRLNATGTGAVEFSRDGVPTANDGAALGNTSQMWSDLFLASGGVINFNNGDVTVTHSANTLAFAGASSGYTFDAAVTVTGAVSGSTATGSMVASQAEQETGTATNKLVTPGRQHFHPSAAKTWARVTNGGGTVTVASSFNVTSATDGGVGQVTINITTGFSSSSWAYSLAATEAGFNGATIQSLSQAAGSISIASYNSSATLTDTDEVHFIGFGDQA